MRILSVVVAVLLAFGCASGSNEPLAEPTDEPVDVATSTGLLVLPGPGGEFSPDTMVICRGDPPFPAGALSQPTRLADTEIAPGSMDPIDEFLQTGEGDFWPQDGFWVLDNTETTLLLAHVGSNGSVVILGSERLATDWQTTQLASGAPCAITVPLPDGLSEVTWRLDPAKPANESSTTISVLATGQACSSGQPMGDRLRPVELAATADSIYVLLVAEAPEGSQTCQGNPEEPVTIDLGEPLGSRQIIDARMAAGLITDYLPVSD